jgi:hypothetical protein
MPSTQTNVFNQIHVDLKSGEPDQFMFAAKIDGKVVGVRCLLDSGASKSFISTEFAATLFSLGVAKYCDMPPVLVKLGDGSSSTSDFSCRFQLCFLKVGSTQEFSWSGYCLADTPDKVDVICGTPFMKEHGIVLDVAAGTLMVKPSPTTELTGSRVLDDFAVDELIGSTKATAHTYGTKVGGGSGRRVSLGEPGSTPREVRVYEPDDPTPVKLATNLHAQKAANKKTARSAATVKAKHSVRTDECKVGPQYFADVGGKSARKEVRACENRSTAEEEVAAVEANTAKAVAETNAKAAKASAKASAKAAAEEKAKATEAVAKAVAAGAVAAKAVTKNYPEQNGKRKRYRHELTVAAKR